MHRVIRSFAIVEHILRQRIVYFVEISCGEKLGPKIGDLLTITVLGLGVFGFIAGLSGHDVVQALISAVKFPALFLFSGLVCLPTLYYFSILFGSQIRFLQTITLILSAQAVSAVLLLGFAPISALFWLSGAQALFLVALNAGILGLAVTLGLIFLVQGVLYVQEAYPPDSTTFSTWIWIRLLVKGATRSLVLIGWLAIYGLVSVQLSWMLRPFFGVPLHGHNFWSSMNNLILGLLGSGR